MSRPTRRRESAHTNPHMLPHGNGAEVYEKDSKRLKGYVTSLRPGKNQCEAFDALHVSLGTGTHAECMLMLSTPRAVRAASTAFVSRKKGS